LANEQQSFPAAADRARDAESLRFVWRGVNIGMIVDTVPYGCAIGVS
jgi:hypothetical protein